MEFYRFTAKFLQATGSSPELSARVMKLDNILPNGRVNVSYQWEGHTSYRTYADRDLEVIESCMVCGSDDVESEEYGVRCLDCGHVAQ